MNEKEIRQLEEERDNLAMDCELKRGRIYDLEQERDALAAHVERVCQAWWAARGTDDNAGAVLAMDEAVTATPATSLARLRAQWQAEALENITAHDISRVAKAQNKDAWEMSPIGIAKLVNAMGGELRRRAGEHAS